VVAPTLGPIIPNWLLMVPRRPAFNFRHWSELSGKDTTTLINQVLDGLEVAPERAIWFEHGPSVSTSLVGCGVDYAHIHVLVDPPFSFAEFISTSIGYSALSWRRELAMDAYDSIDKANSYLTAGTQHSVAIAEHVESAGSQFFRRIVAQLVDKAELWDYKCHPHLDNVQKTIDMFAINQYRPSGCE
jgi:ATP adenylyltransferase